MAPRARGLHRDTDEEPGVSRRRHDGTHDARVFLPLLANFGFTDYLNTIRRSPTAM